MKCNMRAQLVGPLSNEYARMCVCMRVCMQVDINMRAQHRIVVYQPPFQTKLFEKRLFESLLCECGTWSVDICPCIVSRR
jgi:hypothetical protein